MLLRREYDSEWHYEPHQTGLLHNLIAYGRLADVAGTRLIRMAPACLMLIHVAFRRILKAFTFLLQDRDSRFTYSQQFQGATVLPIDPVSVGQEERLESQKTWITSQGFVYPGKKSSRESNKHPMEPDFARLDELKKVL